MSNETNWPFVIVMIIVIVFCITGIIWNIILSEKIEKTRILFDIDKRFEEARVREREAGLERLEAWADTQKEYVDSLFASPDWR